MKSIILSTQEVRAQLAGATMIVRPVVPQPKPCNHSIWQGHENEPTQYMLNPTGKGWYCKVCGNGADVMNDKETMICPFGNPGDMLCVRETWNITDPTDTVPGEYVGGETGYIGGEGGREIRWRFVYKASCPEVHPKHGELRWRSAAQMPQRASRLTLENVSVTVKRVRDVTYDEAMAQLLPSRVAGKLQCRACNGDGWSHSYPNGTCQCKGTGLYHLDHCREYWNSRYSKRGLGWDVNPFCWYVTTRRVA